MTMKNKQERENYFRDGKNWINMDTVLYNNIQIKRLKNYPIVEVTWNLDVTPHNYCAGIQIHHRLGYFRVNEDYSLNNCYSMSTNQCVDLMTQIDKAEKEGK